MSNECCPETFSSIWDSFACVFKQFSSWLLRYLPSMRGIVVEKLGDSSFIWCRWAVINGVSSRVCISTSRTANFPITSAPRMVELIEADLVSSARHLTLQPQQKDVFRHESLCLFKHRRSHVKREKPQRKQRFKCAERILQDRRRLASRLSLGSLSGVNNRSRELIHRRSKLDERSQALYDLPSCRRGSVTS